MIKTIILSLVLVVVTFSVKTVSAVEFDKNAEACVNKVSTILGLSLDQQYGSFKLNGAGCTLSIERNEYVSDLNQLRTVELRMDGSNGIYLSLDANEGLKTVNVSKCEATPNAIHLKYSGKNKAGWKGSYSQSVKLNLENGSVVSAELTAKSGGFFSGGKSEKFSCKF